MADNAGSDDTTAYPELQKQIADTIHRVSAKTTPYSAAMQWAERTLLVEVEEDDKNLGVLKGMKNGAITGPSLMAQVGDLVEATEDLGKLGKKIGNTTDTGADLFARADGLTEEIMENLGGGRTR